MRHLLRRQEKSINQKLTGSNNTNQQAQPNPKSSQYDLVQPRQHYYISNRNSLLTSTANVKGAAMPIHAFNSTLFDAFTVISNLALSIFKTA